MGQTRSIPFFNYSALFLMQEKELTSVVHDVMSRGAYIMQKDLEEFERNSAEFLNAKYFFGVANGTDALMLALRASGVKSGDEVIVPSHTFIASAGAIHFVGATPVLVDCLSDHMIDPESVEKAVTKKTTAIMPVQVNGRTCNMDALQRIADNHGLVIVEDAAQAFGSKYKGKNAGTFGKAGTFSFYPAKVLGCFGDGGGIVTNDKDVADKIYQLRDHGRNQEGDIVSWGINSRLDNIQAAILNLKLKTYSNDIERRREMANRYNEALKDVSTLHLPPAPFNNSDNFDVYQNYEIEAEKRDELQKYLKDEGIGTLIQWSGTPVHQFKALEFNVSLPYTDQMFKRCLMIPMNVSLANDDIDYICEKIRKFYGV